MRPEDVPQELYRLARAAVPGPPPDEAPLWLERILAAVLPAHEHDVVDRVAPLYERRLTAAQDELRGLRAENARLREDAEAPGLREELTGLRRESVRDGLRHDAVREELHRLRDDNAALRDLRTRNTALRREADEVRDELGTVRDELARVREELARMREAAEREQLSQRIDRARRLAEKAAPGLTAPPEDCTNTCMTSACDCSGKWRASAWTLDPAKVLSVLRD